MLSRLFSLGEVTVDLSSFITSLTGSIKPSDIITVLASVVGVGMAFFLMWLGIRKAIGAFTSAVRSGKIRL